MTKPNDPRELAVALIGRSICTVQVAAVLADSNGIFSWGWNSAGSGFGEHAEAMCMRRANKKRVPGATLYVAAVRRKSGNTILAKPCVECQPLAARCARVVYRDAGGRWIEE